MGAAFPHTRRLLTSPYPLFSAEPVLQYAMRASETGSPRRLAISVARQAAGRGRWDLLDASSGTGIT